MRITPIFLAIGALFINCATLEPLTPGTCGNGVVDKGEDCDFKELTCGAPNAGVNACRFLCDPSGKTPGLVCKAGSSCAADGICRAPTGTFASATVGVSASVVTLLAGDFDGDHRADIVGSPSYGSAGSSRIHYFDGNANLSTITPLDLPIPLAVVKDLDGDGIDDLGFAIRSLGNGAFGALKGQNDRTFATVLYPAATFPTTDARWTVVTESPRVSLPADVPACAIGLLAGPLFAMGPSTTRLTSLCDGSTGNAGQYNLPIDVQPSDLLGDPQAGVVHLPGLDKLKSACGEVVFATNAGNNPRVYVVDPCDVPAKGTWSTTPPTPIKVTAGPIVGNVYVGEVTNVGTDDILILVGTTIYIFDGAAFIPAPSLAGAKALPLASGDLDGDGSVDFVFSSGIVLSSPAEFVSGADGGAGKLSDKRIVLPRDNLQWAAATIGRFNDDDLPDVLVSFANNQLDVDVLGNGGAGRFTPFTVRSDQIVRAIGSGDFDGDRVQDVAFLQSANTADNTAADLVLAFGSATGAPEAPHKVGSLKNAHGVLSLRDGQTGIDNLAVFGTAPAPTGGPASSSVTVLFGTGGRQQVAPLLMIDSPTSSGAPGTPAAPSTAVGRGSSKDPQHYWQPVSFSIGPFVHAGAPQIVSIATGYTETPNAALAYSNFVTAGWYAGDDANAVGGIDPFKEAQSLGDFIGIDPDKLQTGSFELETITASGELDEGTTPATEIDELVTVTRLPLDKDNNVGVYVVRPGLTATLPQKVGTISNADVDGGDPIQLVDIDGDGLRDAVFIIKIGGKRTLHIMKGDGKGGLGTPVVISTPDDAAAFAPIVTNKPHLELAIVTATKLFLGSLDGTSEIRTGISVPQLTGIVAGDFDGDGVSDLAIADTGTIRLLLQSPVNK